MNHLPLFFDVRGRRVVVVGEGAMADRRAALAASAGAIISRETSAAAAFDGAVAAFVATGDADSDAIAAFAARQAGVPVNVAIYNTNDERGALKTSMAGRPMELWPMMCR